MTIILFLIDSSASMNQRSWLGARPTLLDVGKDAVEKFLRLRQRDPASRGDRYMLLTFEEHPRNIKAGWKEHHNVFMTELKNLTASGASTLGPSLREAFDLLNLNRMQSGIDTYGHGRCPFYVEPSIIIVITDGGRPSLNLEEFLKFGSGIKSQNAIPGAELTQELFRWDQRLFALVLRLAGTMPSDSAMLNGGTGSSAVACDNSPIDMLCEATGGRSYAVTSQRSLMQCLESIVQKVQGGVVIKFEKHGPDPPSADGSDEARRDMTGATPAEISELGTAGSAGPVIAIPQPIGRNGEDWTNCRKLIYVQRSAQKGYSVGHWPIPEAFWNDASLNQLPPRTAHPIIKFTCANSEPTVIDNFPFDKYELEPSPLTQMILSRKQPSVAWQCYIAGSSNGGPQALGAPFGYLKASTSLNCVNLFVMPYNYPVLLPLLDELVKNLHCKPTKEWKFSFDNYIKALPTYYLTPLKRALQRLGAPANMVQDNQEQILSYQLSAHLKRLKNLAKAEFEKMLQAVSSHKPAPIDSIKVENPLETKKTTELKLNINEHNSRFEGLVNDLNDFQKFQIRLHDKNTESARTQCYRNAFDIGRNELIDQIQRMRTNFMQPPELIKYQDEDQMHSLPVSQMGNYQEYLKKMPSPLRELESAPVRQHMFGNPFKLDKSRAMMIDEANDIDLVGNGGASPMRSPKRSNSDASCPSSPNRPKRRPGPLPKDFAINRSFTPTPPASPTSPTATPPLSPSPSSPPPPPSSSKSPSPTQPLNTFVPVKPDESSDQIKRSKTPEPPPAVEQMAMSAARPNSISPTPSDTSHLSDDADMLDEILSITQGKQGQLDNNGFSRLSPPVFNGERSLNGNDSTTADEIKAVLANGLMAATSGDNDIVANNFNNSHRQLNGKRLQLTNDEIVIKRNIIRLVKRPGSDYQEIESALNQLKPPLREYMIREAQLEAIRFKRKNLAAYLSSSRFDNQTKQTEIRQRSD